LCKPPQLAQASFVVGTADDGIQIRGFGGTSWSAADNVRRFSLHVTVTYFGVTLDQAASQTLGMNLNSLATTLAGIS
jgi:hypothetical protein